MKKLWDEFIAFINKGNALALAIGVIIGGAFTTIVSTINAKIISPLIGTLIGGRDLSNSLVYVLTYKTDAAGNFVLDEAGHKIIENAIYWGAFLQAVIDFLLTAVILFAIFKIFTIVTNTVKKIQKMETIVNFKVENKIKLTKKEKAFLEKMEKEKEEKAKKEAEEKAKAAEPSIEEKQLILLQGIYDTLNAKQTKKEQ